MNDNEVNYKTYQSEFSYMKNIKNNSNNTQNNTQNYGTPKTPLPPMSFSMMVDANHPNLKQNQAKYKGHPGITNLLGETPFSKIEPRKIYGWVKDEAVTQCHDCHTNFSMMLRKHHCIPEGTPVTLANGLAIPIEKIKLDSNILAWEKGCNRIAINSPRVGALFDQGKQSCQYLVLEDGREIISTPDHKFLKANKNHTDHKENIDGDGSWTEMQKLKKGDRLLVSAINGVLDDPEEDLINDYVIPGTGLSLKKERERTLAFARLCGLNLTDGHFPCQRGNGISFQLSHLDDAKIVTKDLKILLETDKGIYCSQKLVGSAYRIQINSLVNNKKLGDWFKTVGVTSGKKVQKGINIPSFMMDPACPKSIQREFLGAWYGCQGINNKHIKHINHQDSIKNCIKKIYALLKNTFDIKSASILQDEEHTTDFKELIYLSRVNEFKEGEIRNFGVKFNFTDLPQFMKEIGFRYSIKKQVQYGIKVTYLNYLKFNKNAKCKTFKEFCEEAGFNFSLGSRLNKHFYSLKIIKGPEIYKNGEKIQLYDLNVPQYESFIANGVVVHNCRLCGRIFCYQCSQERMHVPTCLQPRMPVPETQNSTFNKINPLNLVNYYSSDKSRSPISPLLEKTQEFTEQLSNAINMPKILEEGRRVVSDVKDQIVESPRSEYFSKYYMKQKQKQTPDKKMGEKLCKNELKGNREEDYGKEKVRVCKECCNKLREINKLERMITIFKLVQLDIMDWKIISQVCKTWRQIANYYLSRFREIQYYLPGHKLNIEDRNFLWINREYLIGHGLWMVQLLRSIDYEDYDIREERLKIVSKLISRYMEYEDLIKNIDDDNELSFDFKSNGWLSIDTEYSKLGKHNDTDNDLFNFLGDFTVMDGGTGNNKKDAKNHKNTSQSVFANFGCYRRRHNQLHDYSLNRTRHLDLIEMREIKTEKNNKKEELKNLVNKAIQNQNRRKASCWQLMCSRYCHSFLRPEDALTLLDHSIQSKPTRELAVRYLGLASNWELRCYLPLLIHNMRYETIENSVIGNFILKRCLTLEEWDGENHETSNMYLDPYFMNDVYWQLKINLESKAFFPIYKFFLDKFCHEIPREILETIFKGQHLVNLLETLPNNNKKTLKENELKESVHRQINQSTIPYLTIPTEPFLDYFDLDLEKFQVKQSATRPIILPFKYETTPDGHDNVKKEEGLYQVLYKSEDIRKDQIVMKIIELMDLILKEEEDLDLNIITYEVRPTSSKAGLIEIIPDCATMYQIKERMKISVLNYIIENNLKETGETLRERFLQSCAAYCVITYLLGIGDRHLDNIMVTKDGVIFHIDYGFILGFDPKPMTSPKIRIDPDMIDALGGLKSQNYIKFKNLCNRIYNCLRRHVNLFINLLSLLIEVDPPIENKVNFTRQILMEEIMRRFIPGESYQEAELQLISQLENSNNTYGQYLNDFFHYHAREKTIQSTITGTYNGTKNMLAYLFSGKDNNDI